MNPQTQLATYNCLLDGVFRLAEAYGLHAGWMEAYAEARRNHDLQWLVDAANTIAGTAPSGMRSLFDSCTSLIQGVLPVATKENHVFS